MALVIGKDSGIHWRRTKMTAEPLGLEEEPTLHTSTGETSGGIEKPWSLPGLLIMILYVWSYASYVVEVTSPPRPVQSV